jgi:hypothetical protein
MKTLKIVTITCMLFLAGAVSAQVSVSVNIGSPPMWGPVGYTEVRYYYLPAVEAYYDIQSSVFIYYSGNTWVRRTYLPTRYRNYDLYSGYKVVLTDYHGNAPYGHFKEHKHNYSKNYRGNSQKTIGNKPGKGNASPKNRGGRGNGGGHHKKN